MAVTLYINIQFCNLGVLGLRIGTYIIRRLLLLIPVLLGLSLLVFSLTSLVGDRWTAYVTSPHPTQAQINAVIVKYHLNANILTQYGYWLNGILAWRLGVFQGGKHAGHRCHRQVLSRDVRTDHGQYHSRSCPRHMAGNDRRRLGRINRWTMD